MDIIILINKIPQLYRLSYLCIESIIQNNDHFEWFLEKIGYWSALATAPTPASAGAKEASNSTKFCFFFAFCLQP